MQTLIIYDNSGYIIDMISGVPLPREPQGVPFLWVEVPTGKQIKITNGIGVDVSVTPNVAILEDIPPTETEILQADLLSQSDRFSQKETDDYAFQEYVLSMLPQ